MESPNESMSLDQHSLYAENGRALAASDGSRRSPLDVARVEVRNLEWRQAAGGALIIAAVIALALAWFGIARTDEPWEQIPFLASGGIGAAILVALAVTCLVSFEHSRDRVALAAVLRRIEAVELKLDAVLEIVERESPASPPAPARRPRPARPSGSGRGR